MSNAVNTQSAVLSDGRSLERLKTQSRQDPKAAIRAAAEQFEALFMQEVLKSMRQATLSSGLMDSAGGDLGQEMLDTQYASTLSGRPGGLSDVIAQQLGRQLGLDDKTGPHVLTPLNESPQSRLNILAQRPQAGVTSTSEFLSRMGVASGGAAKLSGVLLNGTQDLAPVAPPAAVARGGNAQSFVDLHRDSAERAAQATGLPPAFLIGQAAHETGWGKKQILHQDGSPSFNLFGIKAGKNWNGPVAEILTTEYIDGAPRKMVQKFRAYGSYAESFNDYARLMLNNPRYSGVPGADNPREFARNLQAAGYATDPAYANKLERVIQTARRLGADS